MSEFAHEKIYKNEADFYELLISREDYQENLFGAIAEIVSPEGLRVVDSGTGTGRLARWLCQSAEKVLAFDRSPAMLTGAEDILSSSGCKNWTLCEAEHDALPVADGWADLFITGWSLSYLIEQFPERWQEVVEDTLSSWEKKSRPAAFCIVIESLGTGYEEPQPPDKMLAAYYNFLEHKLGFSKKTIRTDYRFESCDEAAYILTRFFGNRFEKVNDTIIPECTGIWWKRFKEM
ncbi:class I SAM-dependent methyltransferase [Candidatus Riflebacteria bacterium]